MQNEPLKRWRTAELEFWVDEVDTGTSKFELSLSLEATPAGVTGWFEYRTALFDAATIERMAGHYRTLLAAVAADPAQRLSELPLLAERRTTAAARRLRPPPRAAATRPSARTNCSRPRPSVDPPRWPSPRRAARSAMRSSTHGPTTSPTA